MPNQTEHPKTVGEVPIAVGKMPEPPKVGDRNIAPTTTAADDLITEGQRAINLKWESTQQIIAITTTLVVLALTSYMVVRGDASDAPFLLLSNVLVLVLTNYFQRTNHQRIGGVQKGDAGR